MGVSRLGAKLSAHTAQALLGAGLSTDQVGAEWAAAVVALARQVHAHRAGVVAAVSEALAGCLGEPLSTAPGPRSAPRPTVSSAECMCRVLGALQAARRAGNSACALRQCWWSSCRCSLPAP